MTEHALPTELRDAIRALRGHYREHKESEAAATCNLCRLWRAWILVDVKALDSLVAEAVESGEVESLPVVRGKSTLEPDLDFRSERSPDELDRYKRGYRLLEENYGAAPSCARRVARGSAGRREGLAVEGSSTRGSGRPDGGPLRRQGNRWLRRRSP